MARTEGSKGKLNLTKESAKVQDKVGELSENSTTPEMNMALLKAGAGLSLHTLIRAVAGDKSLEGLSATNMISAADKLLSMYVKVLGDEAFSKLIQESDKLAEEEVTEEQEENLATNNISFIKRYTEKQ